MTEDTYTYHDKYVDTFTPRAKKNPMVIDCINQNTSGKSRFGATRGVMVSTSAFMACHQ